MEEGDWLAGHAAAKRNLALHCIRHLRPAMGMQVLILTFCCIPVYNDAFALAFWLQIAIFLPASMS